MLSAYVLDRNDRLFKNLIFLSYIWLQSIIIPVVLMFRIDGSKPRASFYLLATGPSLLRISEDSDEAKRQMKASPYWSLNLLKLRYLRAVWPEWI